MSRARRSDPRPGARSPRRVPRPLNPRRPSRRFRSSGDSMVASLPEIVLYLHPVWQVAALLLMGIGLSIGLRLRRERKLPWDPAVRTALVKRHLAVTATFLGMLTTGHVMGLITMAYLRHKPLFRSAHAYFGTIALAL